MFRRLAIPRAAIVASGVLLLAACGGESDDATAEVATLQSADDAVGDAADAAVRGEDPAEELTPDEAALEFSQCMRDEGLDFPDLSVDAEGNIELRQAFQSVDREADGFREASDACIEILQQTGFGGGRQEALQSPEVQDALLEFSACVRDAGYDVGDLTLQGRGPGQGAGNQAQDQTDGGEGGEGGGQQGSARQDFGGRGARFANQLGLDYEDQAVQEAIDGCEPIIDEAFANAGLGQPAGG